jgi:hypothetical protein
MISWTTDSVIHRIIKRDIPASERGTIQTFNDIPDWMVEEARTLARESPLAAVRYLKFYITEQHFMRYDDFITDVLLQGKDAATWEIRDCICFPIERTCTTALEIDYLNSLDGVSGDKWFRIKPKTTDHHSSRSPGAVGILRRDVRYWQTISANVGDYPVTSDDFEIVTPDKLASTVRRWIAHRLAWWTNSYLKRARSDVTGADIIAAVPEVNQQRVTPDARIAADALAKETLVYYGSPNFPQQAGFLGLEEWYQSPIDTAPDAGIAPTGIR